MQLIYKEPLEVTVESINQQVAITSKESEEISLSQTLTTRMMKDYKKTNSQTSRQSSYLQSESHKTKEKKELENEIKIFMNIISSKQFIDAKIIHTQLFWLKYKDILPKLTRLSLYLLTIQASSAPIERFFSICGKKK